MKSIESAAGIGRRVEELRILNNETRRNVADILQVSPSYTSRLLDDKVNWSMKNVKTIAEHYHVSIDYVISGVNISETESQTDYISSDHLIENILHLEKTPKKDRLKMVALSLKCLSDLLMKSAE